MKAFFLSENRLSKEEFQTYFEHLCKVRLFKVLEYLLSLGCRREKGGDWEARTM